MFTPRQNFLLDYVEKNLVRASATDDGSWSIIRASSNRAVKASERQPSQREAHSLLSGRFVHLVVRPDLGNTNGIPARLVQLTDHGRWARKQGKPAAPAA